jgi:hypothetical protein
MKTRFEKFVDEHRTEFDDKTPSERVWHKISGSLFGTGGTVWNSVIVWRAAAIFLLGLSMYLFLSKAAVNTEAKPALSQHEFHDIESFYFAQIIEKAALISNEGPFADDSFTQDLQKLEAMYAVMSEEMKKHPSEKVKEALVLNMLVRIDLLNQQIQKLEDSKKKKQSDAATI